MKKPISAVGAKRYAPKQYWIIVRWKTLKDIHKKSYYALEQPSEKTPWRSVMWVNNKYRAYKMYDNAEVVHRFLKLTNENKDPGTWFDTEIHK